MKLAVLLLLASAALRFDITEARGKKASGGVIEAGAPDADGWSARIVGKGKGEPVLVWPLDASAKVPDGPEPIPAIVIQSGDEKAHDGEPGADRRPSSTALSVAPRRTLYLLPL